MIILDTNVVSEPMRREANPLVQSWLDQQALETLYLTSISLAELMLGIEVLPDGKRKQGLVGALAELLTTLFGPRILPFDGAAAAAYAPLVSRARASGQLISLADGQIGAIASVYEFTVATRDTKPFLAAGIPTINPWET